MEVIKTDSLKDRVTKYFFKEPLPFAKRRDINWPTIKRCGIIGVIGVIVVVLLLPTPKKDATTFHESAEAGAIQKSQPTENNPTQETLAQFKTARANAGAVSPSIDSFYHGASAGGGSHGRDRNSSMILTRDGGDAHSQLPAGTKIAAQLVEKVSVSNQAMPVIGLVTHDVIQEDGLAIPQGSKLFGNATFNDSSERANILWASVRLPDGRERQISAIGVDQDGQAGIEGSVHSEAVRNAVGQTITRFIGAYAEGSMEHGMLGASYGGSANGLKNAVAETAKDRANAWGEDMSKEKKWIELPAHAEVLAVLTQPFTFRDPGGH